MKKEELIYKVKEARMKGEVYVKEHAKELLFFGGFIAGGLFMDRLWGWNSKECMKAFIRGCQELSEEDVKKKNQ